MSDIAVLKDAIYLNRQELLDHILYKLGVNEIDQVVFEELLEIIDLQDIKRDKILKALEAQSVIDAVLKDKLT